MTATVSHRAATLRGNVHVPGDKSVSHRSLMLGALAVGETRISGLLEGEDVLATAAAMSALGAQVTRQTDGTWQVYGCGIGGLTAPDDVLDMGNSGTAARLLMGILAGHPLTATMTGDASLRSRPMERIMKPLRDIGAMFVSAHGGRLPITISGTQDPIPITFELPVASAQLKSAVLLAGLSAPGETSVIETVPTRDHTERLLRQFGADIRITKTTDDKSQVSLTGQPELKGQSVTIPADISSAAFPIVAALSVPSSDIRLDNIGNNPLRTGLIDTLIEMGADIERSDERHAEGEPVCDLTVRAGPLRGVNVPPERAPSMIDEFPVLAVAAATAQGVTRMTGLAELRIKESDRLALMAKGLAACGVRVEETADSLTVHGCAGPPPGGTTIDARLDHRIAMSFLVLGATSENPIRVKQTETITTSFPDFAGVMNKLGARMDTKDEDAS